MPVAKKVRECASSQVPVDIWYEEFLPNDDESSSGSIGDLPALLMVPGLNAQSVMFEDRFCQALANSGPFRVIRMDNRDTGHSTKMDHQGQPWKYALVAPTWLSPTPMYTLRDMAMDAWALLDQLGVERASLLGNSMGGMIVQWMALQKPERCVAMIPTMTTTAGAGLPNPPLWVQASFLGAPSDPNNIDVVTEYKTGWVEKVLLAPHHPRDEETKKFIRQHVRNGTERSMYRTGILRQMMAIHHTGPREELLKELKTPTLVIHGSHDNIFHVDHATRFKDVMPHSQVQIVQDMGHFFEPKHWEPVSQMVGKFVQGALKAEEGVPSRRQRS